MYVVSVVNDEFGGNLYWNGDGGGLFANCIGCFPSGKTTGEAFLTDMVSHPIMVTTVRSDNNVFTFNFWDTMTGNRVLPNITVQVTVRVYY